MPFGSERLALPTRGRGYAAAVVASALAAGLQWAVLLSLGVRIPFMFFLPAVGIIAFVVGSGPALVTMIIGTVNAVLMLLQPGASPLLTNSSTLATVIYLGVSVALIYAAHRAKVLYDRTKTNEALIRQATAVQQRQLVDLQQLHELSAQLAMLQTLPDQLNLILRNAVDMQGASRGLLVLIEPRTKAFTVAASTGFGASTIERFVRERERAYGLACIARERVVVRDIDADARCADWAPLARSEGVRAVHSTPLIGHDAELLGALSVYFGDPHEPTEREIRLAEICARKAVVYIERSTAEALAQSRDERFRIVLESSAVPFAVLEPVRDSAGAIVDFAWQYVNTAAARRVGRPVAELVGRPISNALPRSWLEHGVFDRYMGVAERGEVHEFEFLSSRDGAPSWLHVVASPIDGDVAVWFADITDRKQQELELRNADRRKDEFLATLAHELRNPLAPIRQAAAVLRSESATEAQKSWCHDVIERQLNHMSLLLEDLLDVSRITRNTLELRKEPAALAAIIESAVETARPFVEAKRHHLRLDVPEPAAHLIVDAMRMSQIVSNLLTNAAKYTDAGGEIDLSAHVVDRALVLTVRDNGIGLTESELRSLFTMFSQIKTGEDRSEGGLGIGLALTKALVELHGGTITAWSAGHGTGSRFTVTVPQVLASSPTGIVRDQDDRAALPGRRILLADDNRDAAESLAMLLRLDGHYVVIAHDGEEALALYDANRPDIALLDIGMPRMSGYELAARIRARPNGLQVLLIAITGWGQASDKARAAAAGFDHHLTKPVDMGILRSLLHPVGSEKASPERAPVAL
jgi:PAS domain S-box-containing protein